MQMPDHLTAAPFYGLTSYLSGCCNTSRYLQRHWITAHRPSLRSNQCPAACSIESDDNGSGCAEVTAHFGPSDDPAGAVAAAAHAAGLAAAPEHTTELVPPQMWTQTIEDSYQPLCVVPAGQHSTGMTVRRAPVGHGHGTAAADERHIG